MKKPMTLFGIVTIVLLALFIERGMAMGILDKLFGRSKAPSSNVVTGKDFSEHKQFIDSLRKPSIRIDRDDKPGLNKIGGLPISNAALKWPEWKGKPLAFLCQVDLETMPKSESSKNLPGKGLLYFFYDQEQSTWGFDPNDRGSWRILYIDASKDLHPINAPAGLRKEYIYEERYIKFSEVLTYPDWQDGRIDKLNLNDRQLDEYVDWCSSVFGNQPAHHFLGYPAPIQDNDMDLQSQLVSNGLYCGDSSGYNDPRAKVLKSGRSEWVLLLQLDSDDDAGMMWGDLGRLYFWIRKEDLRNRNFDNAWMILQCS